MPVQTKTISVAIAGNPNSGKTTIFNKLTGAKQRVGNYPGVTVEKKEGFCQYKDVSLRIVDLPGTYSLTAYSMEEVVARKYIVNEKPDILIDVLDASNLERNLFLAVQFLEMEVPIVLVLNMADLAEQKGYQINLDKLSNILGVPVIPTQGHKGKGLNDLLEAVYNTVILKDASTTQVEYSPEIEVHITNLIASIDAQPQFSEKYPSRWFAIKLLENDTEIVKQVSDMPGGVSLLAKTHSAIQEGEKELGQSLDSVITNERYAFIGRIYRQIVTEPTRMAITATDRLDNVLCHRVAGPVLLMVLLYSIYKFTFWASDYPVMWVESFFTWLSETASGLLANHEMLQSLVVNGIIGGVGGVMGFVPIIVLIFFAIAILEDSGYMARVAFLLDRVMRSFGLHGKSVLALIVSGGITGGCAVPGILASRTLRHPRDRLITILVAPMMNCGAKLPVYALLVAAFFAAYEAYIMLALTLFSWLTALSAAKILHYFISHGEREPFVMEMPSYHWPVLNNLLISTGVRTWQYVKKIGTLVLAISVILWFAMSFPKLPQERLDYYQSRLETPGLEKSQILATKRTEELRSSFAGKMGQVLGYATQYCGFDWRVNIALVGGFTAKEVIVATLGTAYSLADPDPENSTSLQKKIATDPRWSPQMALALLVFVMLYAPCLVTVAVIRKETNSWKWAVFSIIYTTVTAFVLATVIYQIGNFIAAMSL